MPKLVGTVKEAACSGGISARFVRQSRCSLHLVVSRKFSYLPALNNRGRQSSGYKDLPGNS